MNPTRTFPLIALFSLILVSTSLFAQTFDGTWSCDYATIDDQANGTGYNVISVGVVSENSFVALVNRTDTYYLVGYANADSVNGRLGNYDYGGSIAGYHQPWTSGFDLVELYEPMSLAASSDGMIYVANNDPARNILVFSLGQDSVVSTDFRMMTGADSIWAVDVDDQGYVYVTTVADSVTPGSILVFNSIANDQDKWSGTHDAAPLTTITVPDPGELRGVTVKGDGSAIWVSNYTNKKVYCYIGSPSEGYTLYDGFNFTLDDPLMASDSSEVLNPGPWGLGFMPNNNLLFVTADVDFMLGAGYEYGKIFIVNPNTGEMLDTINTAQWNFDKTGSYSSRSGGTVGDVSGYTSTYDVDFDDKGGVYDQSFYGWTVDKWSYSGTLPTIEFTITDIEKTKNTIPDQFSLKQNYPNPFNPSTTIEFSLAKETNVVLKIYNINGELISTLINSKHFSSGSYKLTFDASKLASGTYIYSLEAGNKKFSKKMVLLK